MNTLPLSVRSFHREVTGRDSLRGLTGFSKPFVFLSLLVLLASALAQSGCVGITSAKTASSSNAPDTTQNPTGPSITTQPVSQTITSGQSATFSVVASGTAPLSYQWQLNGSAISNATGATYTTPAETSSNNGARFTVIVSNSTGNATSSAAILTVEAATAAPSITVQPASETISSGQTAAFSVAASGSSPLSYQWQLDGTAISGATASSYTTPIETTANNGARFSVIVSNSAGNATSSIAVLTVNAAAVAPSISAQPLSQTITAGQSATFSVVASGTAPLSYQWQLDGSAISGATGAAYTTAAETSSNNGARFSVIVSNSAGNATSNIAVLSVNAAAVAPSISTQPANQTITASQTATFSVVASGTAPLSYQWQLNGSAISGATSASYTTPTETTSNNGSKFSVFVSNSAGNATSNSATLTVNAAPASPSISTQPASQTITAGQTATFSVAAVGTAPLSYQWQLNGSAIGGATSATYTTPAEAVSNSGAKFSVVVSNSTGSATSSNATLTVNAAPVSPSITTQPVSQTITAGQTATFSVAASGTAPLSYQWQLNGSTINGANSATYTTPVETVSNSGAKFSVVISNSAGNTTSSNATLTVDGVVGSLTSNLPSLGFNSVNVGSNSSLSVILTNNGTASISIGGVSVNGAGYTPSGVSSGLIIAGGGTATLTIEFAPAGPGPVNGSVTITSTATDPSLSVGLSGTGVQPVSHSVSLSWTASTSSVSGYNVFRSTLSGQSYTQINTSIVSTTTFTDTNVTSGQTYYYVVTAVDSAGAQSADSNQATATIPVP